MLPSLQQLARALGGEVRGGQVLAPGPGHSPCDRSLCIRFEASAPDGFVVHSHAGDDPILCRDHVREKTGMPQWLPTTPPPIVASYVYREADGRPYLRVQRTTNKQFWQSHWDRNAWQKGKPQGPKIPYRLPGIVNESTVFVVEGEKCADAVAELGFAATTASEGAGKWTADLNEHFRDKAVYVLADNDQPGALHAQQVAHNLHQVADSVRIVLLPRLPPKGDVVDWLNAGGDAQTLLNICRDAPVWTPTSPASGRVTLPFINMSNWDNDPVPHYEWAVRDRYPLRQTVLFSGEGAAGKSITNLHLCVAHTLGRDWLGTLPEPGPAIFIDAEDGDNIIHIRLADILKHYDATFADVIKGGLHLISFAGEDAVLGVPGRSGKIEPTPLYSRLREAAGDIKPKMIAIASAADVFAGNENDRSQVKQFTSLLTRIAIVANGTVTLISHPSLTGINTGTGLSGSTQWHNSVRARAYMTSIKTEEGEQPETDLREIIFKKNQYGPIAARIVVQYRNGLFLPAPGTSSLDQAALEHKADELFLLLLARLNARGENISPKRTANMYGPTVFVKELEAKAAHLRKEHFQASMDRLFKADKIHSTQYGPPSRETWKLVPGPKGA